MVFSFKKKKINTFIIRSKIFLFTCIYYSLTYFIDMVPAGLWFMVKYKYSVKGYSLLQTFYVDQVDFSTALVIILAQLFSPVFNI